MRNNMILFIVALFCMMAITACPRGGGVGGEATLVSIDVTPEYATIVKGSTQQFTANGHYSDNTTRDITSSIIWSPENPAVATINSLGLATSVSVGQTFIIATLGGINGNLALLTVTADLRPSAPTNVSAAAGNGQVAVSWSAVTGATSYNIFWATTSGVTKSTGTKISNVTSPYLHSSLSNETTYYYIVTAVNSYGESSESLQANATPSATLAAGSLDITFGTGGKVTTGVGTVASNADAAYAMAIQGDGKIVAAGQAFVRPSIDGYTWSPDFALVQYNTDGSLDSTFGTGGIVSTAVGTSFSSISALAIQTDGKIVAVGSFNNGVKNDFVLVRYNVNGSLDSTFGTGGITTTAVGSGNDYAESVAIQGDGKILVSGESWNSGSDHDFALVQYNLDGSLDSLFGTGGKATTDIRSSADNGFAVAIQGDGKIIIAGNASRGSTAIWDIALARFNTDGSLDSTFGTGGKVTTVVGSGSVASDVSIQNDGKIVIAGRATVDGMRFFILVRYNTDGSLDSTFGIGGVVTTAVGSSDDGATAVSILSDGKIMASGRSWNGSNYDFALVRYNTDGSLDSTFGTGGKVTTAVGSGDDIASDMAIQMDGRIVLTGRSWNGSNDDFALVRYLP